VFARGAARLVAGVASLLVLVLLLAAFRLLNPPAVAAGLGAVLAALTLFLAVFFRDPERSPGPGIVSPADGRVRSVDAVGDRCRVSIFMNVTDVHVNRLPLAGRVLGIDDAGAGRRPAFRADAERNVRRRYRLETEIGEVEVVQITGILARRLVSFVRVGDRLEKGDRFGMIVLGSRVDVWMPAARSRPTVAAGARVRAGSTSIAEIAP
jgi:phosphatidylserine decarboxylase